MAKLVKKIFPIIGMHCASCKVLIESTVGDLEGVSSVNVNYATEKMTFEYDPEKTDIETIKKAVEDVGSYKVVDDKLVPNKKEMAEDDHKETMADHEDTGDMGGIHDHASMLKAEQYQKLKNKVLLVGLATIPFWGLMLRMGLIFAGVLETDHAPLGMLEFDQFDYSINLFFVVQFLLATPVLFWGGSQFFSSAWKALKAKTTNMDTLIALGTTVAWAFSSVVTFFPRAFESLEVDVFFEASVFIVFFILLGRLLEARAKGQANDAIKKLLHLQAKEATILKDGKEKKVPISEVVVGDTIVVKPGEKIPVDGKITMGRSTIDESMVTGESIPADKVEGDKVIGSTINKTGNFEFKAESVGEETMLSQIIQMVEEAQGTTANIQKLADKVSSVFVPVVITIALLSFIFWFFVANEIGLVDEVESLSQFSIFISTAVLIIACPCALGLATPTAVMVGTGKAASKGILVKDAQALELAHKIDAIVFDKTGTLTKGEPEVTEVVIREGEDKKFVLSLASSVEKKSEHPLSEAIVRKAKHENADKSLSIKDFKIEEGQGVYAKHEDKEVVIGNSKILTKYEVKRDKVLEEKAINLANQGKTLVSLALAKQEIAIFAIADTVKEDARTAIDELHKLKIEVVMLTGDNEQTANAIAEELGIDQVIADVLPEDKLNKIKELQNREEGKIIAMVGDGINDAPALAQADIGIAMGTGTDVAIESGDIILVKGTLDKVVKTIELSNDTLKIIKQNLFWAFGYNVIAIPIAAGILFPFTGLLLSPIIASAAMAFSSVSVVLNSLRLKK